MGQPTPIGQNLDSMLLERQKFYDEVAKVQRTEAVEKNRAAAIERYLKNSGMSERHLRQIRAGFKNEHPEWKKNMDKLRAKLGGGVIVALLGGRGTGKTLASTIVVEEACQNARCAAYTTAPLFYLDLRDSYRDGAKISEKEVIQKHLEPGLLVIDEVHERGDTAWSDRMLTLLIDQRYQRAVDTILIANQTVEEFTASIGASIVDRERDGGGILMYDWQSFRGTK